MSQQDNSQQQPTPNFDMKSFLSTLTLPDCWDYDSQEAEIYLYKLDKDENGTLQLKISKTLSQD